MGNRIFKDLGLEIDGFWNNIRLDNIGLKWLEIVKYGK